MPAYAGAVAVAGYEGWEIPTETGRVGSEIGFSTQGGVGGGGNKALVEGTVEVGESERVAAVPGLIRKGGKHGVYNGFDTLTGPSREVRKMNKKKRPKVSYKLVIYAVVLIAIIALIPLFASWDKKGLMLNIFTEVLGISITVIIIQELLDRAEKRKWTLIKELVLADIRGLIWYIVHFTSDDFGVTVDDLKGFNYTENPDNDEKAHWEFENWKLENVVISRLNATLCNFSIERLVSVRGILVVMLQEINRIVDTYSLRIEADVLEMMMRLHKRTSLLISAIDRNLQKHRIGKTLSNREIFDSSNLENFFLNYFESIRTLGNYFWPSKV